MRKLVFPFRLAPRSFTLTLILCVVGAVAVPAVANQHGFVKLKRAALWVPDLDRAIVFYRDVLGFSLSYEGELEPKPGSVLFDLFQAEPVPVVRRALFSSSTEEGALFVMEMPGAPEFTAQNKRPNALVVQTRDLATLLERATNHNFKVSRTHTDIAKSTGQRLLEAAIFGPGGQSVLAYQLVR